jgi:hypothetical protein
MIPNYVYLGIDRHFWIGAKKPLPPKNLCQPPFSDWVAKKPVKLRQKTDKSPKTFRMNTELLRQKLAELIIELTDADLGELTNIYEAIECIMNECEITS